MPLFTFNFMLCMPSGFWAILLQCKLGHSTMDVYLRPVVKGAAIAALKPHIFSGLRFGHVTLLQNLCYNASSDSPAAFADSETQAFFHGH